VWAGFVSGYKPAAGVSEHVNQASSFIRRGVPAGKSLCGIAEYFQHIYCIFFAYNKAYKFTCTKQIVTDT